MEPFLHIAGSFLGSFVGSLIRGSKLDPRVSGRLDWLTRGVKALAARASHRLDPEPFTEHFEEASDPGKP